MPDTVAPSRIEELLEYLHLAEGRGFTGSFVVWMYGGRISRGTFQKLRQSFRVAGIPVDDEER